MARAGGLTPQQSAASGGAPPARRSDDTVRMEIHLLDAHGFGLGFHDRRYVEVPLAASRDVVEVRLVGGDPGPRGRWQAELVRILEPSPGRVEPTCRHFGVCGGCTTQHVHDDDYADWKVGRVTGPLEYRGVRFARIDRTKLARTPPGGRRRIDLTALRTGQRCRIGLNQRGSRRIVDMQECPVVAPAIAGLVAPLRTLLGGILPDRTPVEVAINLIGDRADVLVVPPKGVGLDLPAREAIAAFVETHDVARFSWGPRGRAETVVQRHKLELPGPGAIGPTPPPGAFLQASFEGERTLQATIARWAAGSRRIVDLYGGLGTLSLPLAADRSVTICESDRAAVEALLPVAAAGPGRDGGSLAVMQRNLSSDPLTSDELGGFDFAIVDPPRAGARRQVQEIAASRLKRVAMVACEPMSFSRDARRLADAGFRLEELLPIDQFLWTGHVELAALFVR